jgi:hypothetical protein
MIGPAEPSRVLSAQVTLTPFTKPVIGARNIATAEMAMGLTDGEVARGEDGWP